MRRTYVRPPTGTARHPQATHTERCGRIWHDGRRPRADRVVTLRDGRRIGLTAFGDPMAQRIVLLCHPAPGSGGFDPDPAITSSWGVHVVSVDRPGYGSSTPLPDDRRPSIGRWADDLAEYIEFVIEQARETGAAPLHKVGAIGWSAGGRVALALAAKHPGLVDRVAIVATPAPDTAVRWIPPEFARINAELLQQPMPVAKQRLREMLRSQIPGGVARRRADRAGGGGPRAARAAGARRTAAAHAAARV